MADADAPYRLSQPAKIGQQIRALAGAATGASILPEYLEALETMVHQLETRPLEWGDPERRAIHAGAMKCHAACPPLIVYYVVYEVEHVVLITDIKALPRSPLDRA
jgi:hypothetical protein